jgi:hypothetical protein
MLHTLQQRFVSVKAHIQDGTFILVMLPIRPASVELLHSMGEMRGYFIISKDTYGFGRRRLDRSTQKLG